MCNGGGGYPNDVIPSGAEREELECARERGMERIVSGLLDAVGGMEALPLDEGFQYRESGWRMGFVSSGRWGAELDEDGVFVDPGDTPVESTGLASPCSACSTPPLCRFFILPPGFLSGPLRLIITSYTHSNPFFSQFSHIGRCPPHLIFRCRHFLQATNVGGPGVEDDGGGTVTGGNSCCNGNGTVYPCPDGSNFLFPPMPGESRYASYPGYHSLPSPILSVCEIALTGELVVQMSRSAGEVVSGSIWARWTGEEEASSGGR